MDKSTKNFVLVIICLAVIASILIVYVFKDLNSENKIEQDSSEIIVPIEKSTNLAVEYTSSEITGKYSNYNVKINLNNMSLEGTGGVSIYDTTIKISSGGTYYFTGTSQDANIVIEAPQADVILAFDNCNITCTNTAVINCIKASTLIINSVEGSTNYFTDSSSYSYFTDGEEPDGTIFSKADMLINGNGKMVITSNYNDAIVSKDTLKIVNADIEIISSKDDGIRSKDYTAIKDSTIKIKADGDGIKSTNTDTAWGYVIIEKSKIDIEAGQDGIQAESVLNISESEISIKTSGNTKLTDENGENISSKGLKAGTEITINSGSFNIESTDDTIHSNNYVIINDGTFELSSGDDGIHADNNILINGGNISIVKSYEGIEACYIKIAGGDISLQASDDGINVSGGNDNSGFGGPGEMQMSTASTDDGRLLVITGGNIDVYSEGDGLDSNGSIQISGGNITVAGSINGGNGAIDYDNKCTVTGGSLICYGSNGMWQNPSNDSTQKYLSYNYSGKSGDEVELTDGSGNIIASFTAKMNFGMECFSNGEINEIEEYTLYINGISMN